MAKRETGQTLAEASPRDDSITALFWFGLVHLNDFDLARQCTRPKVPRCAAPRYRWTIIPFSSPPHAATSVGGACLGGHVLVRTGTNVRLEPRSSTSPRLPLSVGMPLMS